MVGLDPRRRKLRKIIQREFTASVMNDTKWNKALAELRELPLRFRTKFITEADVSQWDVIARSPANYIELPSTGGPYLVLEIEYLEIDTFDRKSPASEGSSIDRCCEVEALLERLHVPYSKDGDIIRIVGHVRSAGRSS